VITAIADAVDESTSLRRPRHQDARDRRTDGSCGVDDRRVERDRVDEVFLADHFDDEGLARGDVEGADDAEAGGEREDVPDLHAAREHQRRERQRKNHRRGLCDHQDAMAVVAIGNAAADRGQEEHGNLAGESGDAEQRRRPCQTIRPRFGDPCIQVPTSEMSRPEKNSR
jgi:hypothetical protein